MLSPRGWHEWPWQLAARGSVPAEWFQEAPMWTRDWAHVQTPGPDGEGYSRCGRATVGLGPGNKVTLCLQ